jgi:hypothetical protein
VDYCLTARRFDGAFCHENPLCSVALVLPTVTTTSPVPAAWIGTIA